MFLRNINQHGLGFFLYIIIIFILFVSFFSNAASSSFKTNDTPRLLLIENQNLYVLSGRFSYFIDDTNQLTLSELRQKKSQGEFTLINADNLMLGYIKSTVWLTFTIKNQRDETLDWVLNLDYPLLDQIDIYSVDTTTLGNKNEWAHQRLGDNFIFSERPINHRTFASNLSLSYQQEKTFFIRVQTSSSMQLRPLVSSASEFFSQELGKEMFYGVIYGIMLFMAIYNIFLYLAVRDVSYLVYVCSVFSGCIFIMALNGHAYQYLWPNSPLLANKAIPLFTSLWMTSTALFTQIFLGTKSLAPRLYTAINVLIAFALFSVGYSLLGDYQIAIKVATALSLFNGALILIASIVCWRAGNRFARFFVVAWLVFALGTAMLVLSRFGVLADNFVTHNSASLGLLVEIIMLSLALSDKYRVLSQELELHAVELEHKVAQRTEELEQSNALLEKLSRDDCLTGLPNRRSFDAQLSQEWERASREHKEISILVCDVDQFKLINDHFGHQYGDECLQAVAKVLSNALHRPADLAARFGGDEFVVILPDTCELGAKLIGIKIAELMQELTLAQAPQAQHQYVTLSIGCSTLTPSENNSIKTLFSLADQNLYRVKEKGRNGVV